MNIELVPIALFAMIFGIVYVGVRQKERMAMIERGDDLEKLNPKQGKKPVLKWALLLIGIAAGFVVGDILESMNILSDEIAYISMVFLFAGIGLLLYMAMEKTMRTDE